MLEPPVGALRIQVLSLLKRLRLKTRMEELCHNPYRQAQKSQDIPPLNRYQHGRRRFQMSLCTTSTARDSLLDRQFRKQPVAALRSKVPSEHRDSLLMTNLPLPNLREQKPVR